MGEFALFFSQSKADPTADELLRRIHQGSEAETNQALNELVGRAQNSQDPDEWNAAALGFHYAGLNDQATQIFNTLVQNYPDRDIYRLNLATSYAQTEQVELCRHHFQQLAQNGSSEQLRQLGIQQLEGYERFLGLTEDDERLRELQIKSLSKAIAGSEPARDDFIWLARILILRSKLESGGNWLEQAVSVLERGRKVFPDDKAIVELLVAAYLRHDPEGRLNETLIQLEKIDPNSAALELLASQNDEDTAKFSENIHGRVDSLIQIVVESNDTNGREAALQDLGKIVAMYPQNSQYRLTYAFALMILDRREAALQEAQRLSELDTDVHSFHFNLGQIFWICGDPPKGRHHLNIALSCAKTEQERQEVSDRIAALEK
jgi:tetratricopeptide (TPR) repeat protein